MKLRVSITVVVLAILLVAAWFSWKHVSRDSGEPGKPQRVTKARLEELEALPYLDYVVDEVDPERNGVTAYNRESSSAGFNLLTSLLSGGSHLLDMNGEVLHSWLPGDSLGKKWVHSEMDRDGNLMVLIRDVGIAKMDWDSNVLWIARSSKGPFRNQGRYHHDFTITEAGDIWVLAREVRYVDHPVQDTPIRDNSMIMLDRNGVPQGKISFCDLLGEKTTNDAVDRELARRERGRWKRKRRDLPANGLDVFHCNTIEEVPRNISIADKGNLLFCVRNLDLIGILDTESRAIIWSWGPGELSRPHHPTILENGNILVFDNGLIQRRYSRVVEIDPARKEIIWEYKADPPQAFFTALRGGNQRLPNGNTLVTESDKGHVFEVTQQGDIVWDFWNPESNEDGRRMVIYRMTRYPRGYLRLQPSLDPAR